MTFAPQVNIIKYGDRLTVLVRQKYYARGSWRGRCPTCGLGEDKLKCGKKYDWLLAQDSEE